MENNPVIQGIGLGLTIAALLVEHMGGHLFLVYSEPDNGSTFRFTVKNHTIRLTTTKLSDLHNPETPKFILPNMLSSSRSLASTVIFNRTSELRNNELLQKIPILHSHSSSFNNIEPLQNNTDVYIYIYIYLV